MKPRKCPECLSEEIRLYGDKVVRRGEYGGSGEVIEEHDTRFFVGEIECSCIMCGNEWVVGAEERLQSNEKHGDELLSDACYRGADSLFCPQCGEDTLERSGQLEVVSNACLWESVECTSCGLEFYDVWKCDGYVLE